MKPRPIHWIAAIAIVLAYSRMSALDHEDQERAEAHRKETIAAAQAEAKARAKSEAKALARHLHEQHLIEGGNELMHPLGQTRIAAITRRENQ